MKIYKITEASDRESEGFGMSEATRDSFSARNELKSASPK